MNRILFAAIPLAVVGLLLSGASKGPLEIGAPLPHAGTKMMDVTGKEISFNDAVKKQGLLVMFTCNTCPVVRAYRARTNEVCKYAAEREIGVILLNSNEASRDQGDSYNEMKRYASEQGYAWPYVMDRDAEMANIFGATRTPECFLFDAQRKLVYHGAIDNNANGPEAVTRKHLTIAMDEMLAGKSVSVTTTRSVGCSIRR